MLPRRVVGNLAMVALNTVNLRPPMLSMSSSLLRVEVRYC